MSILVVGGSGYIGAHIVDLLCDADFNVIVFDNLSNGFIENLNSKAIFVNGDICNAKDIELALRKYKVDCIIHMAALKSVAQSMDSTANYTKNNIIGSINLISMAIKLKFKIYFFINCSSLWKSKYYKPYRRNLSSESN